MTSSKRLSRCTNNVIYQLVFTPYCALSMISIKKKYVGNTIVFTILYKRCNLIFLGDNYRKIYIFFFDINYVYVNVIL